MHSSMLRVARTQALRSLTGVTSAARISTTSALASTEPKSPVPLDPSLQALLNDVDISIARHKAGARRTDISPRAVNSGKTQRELEVFPELALEHTEGDVGSPALELDYDDAHEDADTAETRKSPAAAFGSKAIGAVVLPLELQNSIVRLIEGSNKSQLREDAKRLFGSTDGKPDASDPQSWGNDYDVRYKSRQQAVRHHERDGTAFASVALPSHYAAITAVFQHLAHRLGPEWSAARVIDWHAGTGSGLWAAAASFSHPDASMVSGHGPNLAQSTVRAYTAIDRREGLVQIGKRVVEGNDFGHLNIRWQKTLQDHDRAPLDGGETVALSAFSLSSLSTSIARKQLIKEMWESGADVFVLIDHNTLAGFQSVAEARAQLLKLGRKEIAAAEFAKSSETANAPTEKNDLLAEDDVTEGEVNLEAAAASGKMLGTHVVAPCPHDGACPLFHPERKSDKLVCGFSQRMQRPSFVRRTKHSGVGHEDIGYSYVVIRRGSRPEPLAEGQPLLGREGMVALRAAARRAVMEADSAPREMQEYEAGKDYLGEETSDAAGPSTIASVPVGGGSVEAALRAEAYQWPRLVFPPLKRSGHVVLDVCSPDARIVRATIPKSQGAQAYYDARKASWGDIFPHAPKNRVQERYTPAGGMVQGSDIGKRGVDDVGNEDMRKRPGYGKIAKEVLKQKKERRREIHERRQEKYEAGT